MMAMRLQRASSSQAGDTLVEVLVAILLVSLILTGAYVTTNRSSLGVLNSQEHAEALKLVQGQLEQVRQAAQPSAAIFGQPPGLVFCMVNGGVETASAPCVQDSAGNATTGQPAYKLAIHRSNCAPQYTPPAGLQCHKFTVEATWDSVAANGLNTEVLTYRLYE